MNSLCTTFSKLLEDFQRLHPDVKGFDRDFVTIKSRIEHEGNSFATITLPKIGHSLDKALSEGRWSCPLGFRKSSEGSLPAFMQGLTRLVFDIKTGLLLENADVTAVKSLRELFYVFKKLNLSDDEVEILDRRAKNEFYTCDKLIENVSSKYLPFVMSISRKVFYRSLDSYEYLKGRHGPGAVAEKLSPNKKWEVVHNGLLDFDRRLIDLGYDTACYNSVYPLNSIPPATVPLRGIARLISVAKNSSSRRTITIEPALDMFIQQALNEYLRDSILESRILRNCLSLSDQSKNQELALEGSRTGEWCTIDLSSASDRLSNELVKSLFAHFPRFVTAVQSCRSERVDTFDAYLNKFAGMGNALTFPVQSICFALISIGAILYSERKRLPTYRDVMRASKMVRVYGDDIIVPTIHFRQVADWLESFGLLVNRKKSFHEGNFRESCGVDAFRGYDVTPLYLRHEPTSTSHLAKTTVGLVSYSNMCWDRGLYSTATYISQCVEKSLGKRLPYVTKNMSCLGWHTRLDAYTPTRWNRHLQTFEVRGLVGRPLTRKDPIDGYPALIKSLTVPLIGRPVGHLKSSERRHTLCLRQRWVQIS